MKRETTNTKYTVTANKHLHTPSSFSSSAYFDCPVDFRFPRKAEVSLLFTSAIFANLLPSTFVIYR